MDKLLDGMKSLDAETVTSDQVEAVARKMAKEYGDSPDSPRCRIDTLKQGIAYGQT